MADYLTSQATRRGLLFYSWLCVAIILAPALVLIPVSFGGADTVTFPALRDWSLQWYANFAFDPRWRNAIVLSLWVALSSTLCATLLGVLASLGINRLSSGASKALKLLFVSPLIVPHLIIGVGFYVTFVSYGLIGSTASLVMAHTILILPFVILSVMARIMAMDGALERAAASCGATPAQTIWRVTLPILRPSIIGGAAFAFMFSFDEVVVAQFISGPTLETLPRLMWDGITVSGLDKTITVVTTLQILFIVAAVGLSRFIGSKRHKAP